MDLPHYHGMSSDATAVTGGAPDAGIKEVTGA
jgi:hypothetical protein